MRLLSKLTNRTGTVMRHKSVDIESRVVDLVKRLTLQKKIGFLVKAAGSVSSLGIS
ncbi:hypothetical protein ACOSP7_030986 [Xanthoceras sorbifolium]